MRTFILGVIAILLFYVAYAIDCQLTGIANRIVFHNRMEACEKYGKCHPEYLKEIKEYGSKK